MSAYTLTGATDWPMLVTMFKAMAWAIGILLSLIAALVGGLWLDFRRQFKGHKDEESVRCSGCKAANDKEFDEIWDTFDHISPRQGMVGKPSDRRSRKTRGQQNVYA